MQGGFFFENTKSRGLKMKRTIVVLLISFFIFLFSYPASASLVNGSWSLPVAIPFLESGWHGSGWSEEYWGTYPAYEYDGGEVGQAGHRFSAWGLNTNGTQIWSVSDAISQGMTVIGTSLYEAIYKGGVLSFIMSAGPWWDGEGNGNITINLTTLTNTIQKNAAGSIESSVISGYGTYGSQTIYITLNLGTPDPYLVRYFGINPNPNTSMGRQVSALTQQGILSGASLRIVPTSSVPIPAAFWLFGTGLLGLFGVRRKMRR
jgi:hypothetical protein